MNKQSGYTLFELVWVIVVLAGVGGWIANIYKLIGASFDPLTGLVVLRCIGIFIAPLGSVLGFF